MTVQNTSLTEVLDHKSTLRLFIFFKLLGEIEEHLNCTIAQVEPDIKVPVDDFDGKVTYGQKRALGGKQ